MGARVGKLARRASGGAGPHAWRKGVDRELLAEAAREVGATTKLVEQIRAAETARFAAEGLQRLGLTVPFHRAMARRALTSLRTHYPGRHRLALLVCDFDGQPITLLEEAEHA